MRTLPPDVLGEGYSQITREQAINLSELGVNVEWEILEKEKSVDFYHTDQWCWDPFWSLSYGFDNDMYDVFFRTRTE